MKVQRRFQGLALGAVLAITGCSGGSGGDKSPPAATATTISGTAATGAALSGTVTAVGTNGKTATVALAANGSFTLTSTDLTFPVLVKADNGTGTVLYSWAMTADVTANITPFTTLALILATDLSDNLDAVFSAWSGSASAFTAAAAQTAQAKVNANLQVFFGGAALDYTNYDFLTTPFAADGSGIDAVLDALDFSFTYSGSDFASVVSLMVAGTNTAISVDPAIDISAISIGGTSGAAAPSIASFTPTSGAAAATVTITGSGFDDDKFHLAVSFANNVAATIVSASKTQIVVTVPSGAVTGKITVTHGISGKSATSASDFTVTGGTAGGDWTARTYGASFLLNAIAYGNSTFVAVGFGNTIATSNDGITWIKRNAPDAYSYTLESVIWDGAQFVMVGDVIGFAPSGTTALVATSPDGVTWTRRNASISGGVAETWFSDVTSGNNRLTVVGKNGKILSSTDNGASWGEQFNPSLSGAYIAGYNGVASSGSTRVAVGGDTAYQGVIIVSTDGVNWSVAESALTTFFPQDVQWNGTLFIAVGATNANFGAKPVMKTSPDGVTWTVQTLPTSIADSTGVLNHVTWNGTQFIAVGSNSGGGPVTGNRFILTSSDGMTWALDKQWSTAGQINSLAGVAASPTQAVVVGDSLWTKP